MTPESVCHSAQAADRDHCTQMTDPDHRHSQARGNRQSISSASSPSPPPPQLNFGFVKVADIPQVHIPEIYRLPTRSAGQPPVAVSSVAGPPLLDDLFWILPTVSFGVNIQFLSESSIPQVLLPPGWNVLLQNPVPVVPVSSIPQVQLSANWNAPLQNVIPVVPPLPVFPRRGRGRPPVGPLHDLSGVQSNYAGNNLHRSHIAQREHAANYQTHLAHGLQEQLRAENNAYLRREEQERQAQMLQEEQRIRIEQQQRETAERIRRMQHFAKEESQRCEELGRQELRRQEVHEQLLAERYWLQIEDEHIRREKQNRVEAESLRLEANRREELAHLAREEHHRQLQTEAAIQRQLELDTEQLRLSSQ